MMEMRLCFTVLLDWLVICALRTSGVLSSIQSFGLEWQ